jgi:type IV pilus assembly protein PilQ
MKRAVISVVLAAALALCARPEARAADEAGGAGEPISLDLNQAKIENVLRLIGRHYGLNVVAGKEVTGTVTLRLVDVTCEEALDAVLRTNGFEYERKGNLLEVRPKPATKPIEVAPPPPPPKPVTRFVPLHWVNGKDVVETLKGLMPKTGGVFEYNEKQNAFFVQDVPDAVDRFESLVRQIDKKTVQVRIEAKIVETLISDSDRLGIDWSTSIKLAGASRPVTFPFVENVKGGPFFPINNGEGVLTTVNTATSSSASRNASFFDSRSGFPLAQPFDFTLGRLDATQFTAVLEALKAQTDTKLVASPEVTTLDNQQAKITIGNITPVPTYTRNEEHGTTTVSGYEKIETGTTLVVVPRVNDEKSITMVLRPEVSDVTGYRGPLQEFPVVETRSAETVVVLEDGKTLVIGGLVRERTYTKTSKFPLLGDIPLLGYLFQYKGEDVEKTNLLIFITPHILDPEKMENEQRGMAKLEGRWVPREAAARVQALRDALAGASPDLRSAAASALGESMGEVERTALRPAETLESLARTDPSPAVRATALVALGNVEPDRVQAIALAAGFSGDPDAAAALALAAVREPSPALSRLEARAAALAGPGEASRRIDEALRSTDAGLRTRALRAAAIAGGATRDALFRIAQESDPIAAVAALDAIALGGGTSESESLALAKLATGASDAVVRIAARDAADRLARPLPSREPWTPAAPPLVVPVAGEGAGPFGVQQALAWLAEKSPRDSHLVRLALAEIAVVDGPTRLVGRRLEIAARDAESWPRQSLAHETVHFATHAFLRQADGERPLALEEARAFEEQFRAIHAIAGEPCASRDALVDFVRRAVAAAEAAAPREEISR